MAEGGGLNSLPSGGVAIVMGASGGIGAALVRSLEGFAAASTRYGAWGGTQSLRWTCWMRAASGTSSQAIRDSGMPVRLVLDATGFLHNEVWAPEKSWQQLDPAHMAHGFAINAIGPALLMKHFLPLLARDGKSVFATLSAKVREHWRQPVGRVVQLPRQQGRTQSAGAHRRHRTQAAQPAGDLHCTAPRDRETPGSHRHSPNRAWRFALPDQAACACWMLWRDWRRGTAADF